MTATTTTTDLLRHALWLCTQVPKLDEISFALGVASHVADPASMPGLIRNGQMIIDAAAKLQTELTLHLAAVTETTPTKPAEIIRLKDHLGRLSKKTAL